MKIRFDFVTNSSSSSYIIRVGVRLNNGKVVKYEAFSEDDGGGCDSGDLKVDRNLLAKAANSKSVDELFGLLEKAVTYRVYDWDADCEVSKVFDSKDFELYADIKKRSYTKDDYMKTDCGFYETDDDLDDGRSVPFSKSIVIFDKAVRKKVKGLDDIKSVIVESVHTASGENIDSSSFPGLDWDESGMEAEYVSIKEIDLKTQKIKEESSTKWV